jgi:hypothetical protein
MFVQDYLDYGMNCDIYVQFNPCNTDSFICESTMAIGGDEFVDDCTEDFADPDFWWEMSEDPWWTRAENQQMYPFFMFWNEYHSDDDYETGSHSPSDYDYMMGDCAW